MRLAASRTGNLFSPTGIIPGSCIYRRKLSSMANGFERKRRLEIHIISPGWLMTDMLARQKILQDSSRSTLRYASLSVQAEKRWRKTSATRIMHGALCIVGKNALVRYFVYLFTTAKRPRCLLFRYYTVHSGLPCNEKSNAKKNKELAVFCE